MAEHIHEYADTGPRASVEVATDVNFHIDHGSAHQVTLEIRGQLTPIRRRTRRGDRSGESRGTRGQQQSCDRPPGWQGGYQQTGGGAVYAVAKQGVAIVVTNDQMPTVKARTGAQPGVVCPPAPVADRRRADHPVFSVAWRDASGLRTRMPRPHRGALHRGRSTLAGRKYRCRPASPSACWMGVAWEASGSSEA